MENVAATRPPEQLRFTGTGGEYFGIWIVNILLTIVTLGIYSAWAKVRRLQYFYRHTEVAGSSFDFHGNPKSILIGRILAFAMLFIYHYTARVHSVYVFLVVAIIAAVMPWLLRNSFRFRLYNTSWRGTRFHFRGEVPGAYRVFLLNGFLAMITLYLLAPFMHQRVKAYQHNNSWFGQTQCSFHARVGEFYRIYLLLLFAIVAFGVIVGYSGIIGDFIAMANSKKQGTHLDGRGIFRDIIILYGALIAMMSLVGPLFHALITNLIWNNTRIGEHRIECTMSPLGLMWISVSNLVLLALTLGFFMPWAMVRLVRFEVECMRLLPASDLQEFTDAGPEAVAAFGAEAANAFDFDISL